MKRSELKEIIKECVQEVLEEKVSLPARNLNPHDTLVYIMNMMGQDKFKKVDDLGPHLTVLLHKLGGTQKR
jgi:hypothetical protein